MKMGMGARSISVEKSAHALFHAGESLSLDRDPEIGAGNTAKSTPKLIACARSVALAHAAETHGNCGRTVVVRSTALVR